MRSIRDRKEAGFTLIELLVVVAIMMVLIGMVMGAVAMVRQQQRRVLASKHVHDIVSACEAYFMVMHQYPTDTGMVELDGSTEAFKRTGAKMADGSAEPDDPAEADAIYMCLGRKVYESVSDTKYGNFLIIHPQHLRTIGTLQIMVDPWGTPYRMDCVHVRSADGAVPAGQADYVSRDKNIERVGAPYAPILDGDPKAGEKRARQTAPVKAWSAGPDKHEGAVPFSHVDAITDQWDEDNISSWR